jgi:COP9 signalosome complex subunit 6
VQLVHKDPPLDLVGWYTILPHTGPQPAILPYHNEFLTGFNESAVFLAFHPDELADSPAGGQLPITIYESISEGEDANREILPEEGEDSPMKDGEGSFKLKFRELPYSIETGEAEMISIDFLARGAANATAAGSRDAAEAIVVEGDAKGKRRAVEKKPEVTSEVVSLTKQEGEQILALTMKANAIRMMHSRIQLIVKYLEQLPPSYLKGNVAPADQDSTKNTSPSNTILRSVQALVNRLYLLDPSGSEAFKQELLSEQNDVHLVSLLDEVMQSIREIKEVGRTHAIADTSKSSRAQRLPISGFESPAGGSFNLGPAGDLIT